jgi:hypothetical protein
MNEDIPLPFGMLAATLKYAPCRGTVPTPRFSVKLGYGATVITPYRPLV